MSRRLTPVIIIVLLLGAQGLFGQELSTSVFPSEDELRQALEQGEIDYDLYQQLVEFALFGISRNDPYLLDAIPNLSALLVDREALATDLEKQQSSMFERDAERRRYGQYRQRWTKELETDGRARYRTSIVLYPAPAWGADVRLAREFSGRERVVYRSISYQNTAASLRALTFGNYSTRFGLGTVFGYRGKTLRYSPSLESESILYPDYGGSNGVLAKTRFGSTESNLAVSNQRDGSHQIFASALQWSLMSRPEVPSIIFGLSVIRNRETGATVRDYKFALSENLRFGRSRIAAEITGQAGSARSFAGVVEGRYRVEATDLTCSLWAYGDDFLTVASGSKSGRVSRTVCLDEVDLDYRDSRAGQEGAWVRVASRFSERWELVNAATFAGFDRSDYRLQWLPALIYRFSAAGSVRFDYQTTVRHQKQSMGEADEQTSRSRIELRFKSDNWESRSYIGITVPIDGDRYFSWLLQVSMESADIGKIDGWLVLDRIRREEVNYWYGYLRHRCLLFSNVELGMKLAHRFNASAAAGHYTAITLELTASY